MSRVVREVTAEALAANAVATVCETAAPWCLSLMLVVGVGVGIVVLSCGACRGLSGLAGLEPEVHWHTCGASLKPAAWVVL